MDHSETAGIWSGLGWALLFLCLPIALVAAVHPANEYKATQGINALDCQGPLETYAFAGPVLLIYGAGMVLSLMRWRKSAHLVVGLACLAVCAAVTMNVGFAVAEQHEQWTDCQARDG